MTTTHRLLVALCVALGLLAAVSTGAVVVLLGRAPKPVPAAGAVPAADHRPPTLSLSRAEFRARVMTFRDTESGKTWDGKNALNGRQGWRSGANTGHHVAAWLRLSDFDAAFGPPARTEVSGEVAVRAWVCRDGAVEVVYLPYLSSKPGIIALVCIDEF